MRAEGGMISNGGTDTYRTHFTFTVFIFCFYLVCAVPLKLSGLRHVNLDVYTNNNNNKNNNNKNNNNNSNNNNNFNYHRRAKYVFMFIVK